jgi:excisionase family DNA binding protein
MTVWITTREAAALTGYNTEYIRQMIRARKITAQKRGRDWWVDHKSLLTYMRRATVSQTQDRRHGARTKQTG